VVKNGKVEKVGFSKAQNWVGRGTWAKGTGFFRRKNKRTKQKKSTRWCFSEFTEKQTSPAKAAEGKRFGKEKVYEKTHNEGKRGLGDGW